MNIDDIRKYIDDNSMIADGDAVVTGVSGGADSVCLLTSLSELRERYNLKDIYIIHVNHMIRGEEADRDEQYVRSLAEKLGTGFRAVKRNIPEIASLEGLSEEEAGRRERYKAFEEAAAELTRDGFRVKIAVAHNRDDLVETVIFNMLRGTSLRGLSGIRPVRGNIIRPLLFAGRDEIEAFLKERNIEYMTDSTNLQDEYSRNRIRHRILGEMEVLNPEAKRHIALLAGDSAALYEEIEKRAESFIKDKCQKREHEFIIDAVALQSISDSEKSEVVLSSIEYMTGGKRKDITRRHLENVISIAGAEGGSRAFLPYGLLAMKSGEALIICRRDEKKTLTGRLLTEAYDISGGAIYDKNTYTEIIDCDKIKGTLQLRIPQEGDSIVISRDGGRKRLRKLFTDMRVDPRLRESYPVVADDNDVIWLPGLRLSCGYMIDDSSKNGLKLTFIEE